MGVAASVPHTKIDEYTCSCGRTFAHPSGFFEHRRVGTAKHEAWLARGFIYEKHRHQRVRQCRHCGKLITNINVHIRTQHRGSVEAQVLGALEKWVG